MRRNGGTFASNDRSSATKKQSAGNHAFIQKRRFCTFNRRMRRDRVDRHDPTKREKCL
jgi:hypothetical protein